MDDVTLSSSSLIQSVVYSDVSVCVCVCVDVAHHLIFVLNLVADIFGAFALADPTPFIVVELRGALPVPSRHEFLREAEALRKHRRPG